MNNFPLEEFIELILVTCRFFVFGLEVILFENKRVNNFEIHSTETRKTKEMKTFIENLENET